MRQQVGSRLSRTVAVVVALGSATGMNLSHQALAQDSISVTLNGQPINFGGVPPTQVGGRVLVPLRGVFEALGAQVDYDAASGTVFAARGNTQVQLLIGSTQATVNGQTRVLDVPAQARLGRTLVPLRFVSEAMGAQVNWNPGTRLVASPARPTSPTSMARLFPLRARQRRRRQFPTRFTLRPVTGTHHHRLRL
jgi:hypothetical protein